MRRGDDERRRQYAEPIITTLTPPAGKRSTRAAVAGHLYVMARRSKRGTIRRYFIGRFRWRGKIREIGLGPASMKTFDKVRKHLTKLITSKRTESQTDRDERHHRASAASRRGLLTRAVNRMRFMEADTDIHRWKLRPALWQRDELLKQLLRIEALIRIEDEAYAIFQAEEQAPTRRKFAPLKERPRRPVPLKRLILPFEGTAPQPKPAARTRGEDHA